MTSKRHAGFVAFLSATLISTLFAGSANSSPISSAVTAPANSVRQVVTPIDLANSPTCVPVLTDFNSIVGNSRTVDLAKYLKCAPTSVAYSSLTYSIDQTIPTNVSADLVPTTDTGNSQFSVVPSIDAATNFLSWNADAATSAPIPMVITVRATDPATTLTADTTIGLSISSVVTAPAPPKCRVFTTSGTKNTTSYISLPFSELTAGGCTPTLTNGFLFYEVAEGLNGLVSLKASDRNVATFVPTRNFTTSADNERKASFGVVAFDEYGQRSTTVDQAGAPMFTDTAKTIPKAYATITVNVSTARGSCKDAKAKTETVFNNPTASASRDKELENSRFAITNRMIRLIDCAKPGSTIAMSWFSVTDDNLVNHLIKAKKAGVHVRFLVNSHATKAGSTSYTSFNTLKAAIGSKIKDSNANVSENSGSWVASCNAGCLTPPRPKGLTFPEGSEAEYPALHSKFFMFTDVGSAKNVVGISSVNPTYEQAKRGFNNASIVVNDKKLFKSMNTYFSDLTKAARGKSSGKSHRNLESNSKYTTYVTYPTTKSDDVTNMFRNIQCLYKENGKTKRTQVYVNMYVFTRNAPAMTLWRLAFNPINNGGGCDIHIIYTDMDQKIKAFNTRTNKWAYIQKKGQPAAYGVADCLSTSPTKRLTIPTTVWDSIRKRNVTISLCKNSSLQGRMPTINYGSNYCWLHNKSAKSGGSLDMCVSTPLKITALDKSDMRAKLEPVEDSAGKKWYTHQKYIAIDGMYRNERVSMVVSGTPNISVPGLRWNDEIMTITKNKTIYKQYLANFEMMRKTIKKRAVPGALSTPKTSW